MTEFVTKRLSVDKDDVAPDGSDVRVLLELERGGMAHFELAPGKVAKAVTHKTVEEIWFFLNGRGEMWRKQGKREEVIPVERGVCLTRLLWISVTGNRIAP
jgi:mannose-6-phosphate isomerase-like protein (cupin superfamily)